MSTPASRRPIGVMGLGAVSAFGRGVEALWSGVLSGESALRVPSALVGIDVLVGQAIEPLGPQQDRALALAALAAREALDDAGWQAADGLGLVVATTKGGIGLAQHVLDGTAPPEVLDGFPLFEVAARLARQLGVTGPVTTVSLACASGTAALARAARWLEHGRCERVLVVGVDALSEFVVQGFGTLRALARDRARPFDAERTGLSPGEGAGAVALGVDEAARAWLTGWGGSNDANHITGPSRDGDGLVRALEAALGRAGLEPSVVQAVNAHATATRFNDAMEARAFQRVFGAPPPVNGIKGALGHTMGAAGVLEAVVCVRGLEAGLWPPTAGLTTPDPELGLDLVTGAPRTLAPGPVVSTSSGFSGINAAVVFSPDRPPVRAPAPPRRVRLASLVRGPTATDALRAAAADLVSRPARLDDLCLAGLVSARHVLDDGTGEGDAGAFAQTRHVVTLGTALGCLESDFAYYRQVLDRGAARTNPRIFAYTLPNVVLGEVAIRFGLTGDQSALTAGRASGLSAILDAADRLAAGEADQALVLILDVVGDGTRQLFEAAGTVPVPTVMALRLDCEPGGVGVSGGLAFDPEPGERPDPDPLGAAGLEPLVSLAPCRLEARCASGYRAWIVVE